MIFTYRSLCPKMGQLAGCGEKSISVGLSKSLTAWLCPNLGQFDDTICFCIPMPN